MIKYYLVENYLSKSVNKFMALVSNPETRNPDDIITHMIDEGTGLTGVFLDGWINRVRDLKFTLSLLILVLSMATTACRSSQPAQLRSCSDTSGNKYQHPGKTLSLRNGRHYSRHGAPTKLNTTAYRQAAPTG